MLLYTIQFYKARRVDQKALAERHEGPTKRHEGPTKGPTKRSLPKGTYHKVFKLVQALLKYPSNSPDIWFLSV